ncbi:MAG: metallophosphoesterase [Clostridia bacterium]|nr:metallophosphoesterase [Clostridia bacterium]
MKKLRFHDGKFIIVQVADAQDLRHVRPTMIRMLNRAYDDLHPDLVVLTGDNILGNHLRDARIGTREVIHTLDGEREALRGAIAALCAPIEKRGIPFASIFGNHDDCNSFTKEDQAEMYRAFSSNIPFDEYGDQLDCGTYHIPLYGEEGDEVKFNLWMFDSAWQDKTDGKCYQAVTPDAVQWYRERSAALAEQNGGAPVPSLAFQHVPIDRTLELLEECPIWKEGAVKGPDGKYYRLKRGCKGELGEYPCTCPDNGLFDAMKERGDVRACVYSHDHCNCYEANLEGIDILQSSCASFRCYGNRYRGVRAFVIDEATGTYETEFFTYDELTGGGVLNMAAYVWDADGMFPQKVAMIGVAAAIVGGVTASAVLLHKHLKKRK